MQLKTEELTETCQYQFFLFLILSDASLTARISLIANGKLSFWSRVSFHTVILVAWESIVYMQLHISVAFNKSWWLDSIQYFQQSFFVFFIQTRKIKNRKQLEPFDDTSSTFRLLRAQALVQSFLFKCIFHSEMSNTNCWGMQRSQVRAVKHLGAGIPWDATLNYK